MSGRLELPPDLVIDPVAVDRLARQLAAAPPSVVAVVAPVDDLPPGASTRVHAEWRSLLPLDDVEDVEADGPVPEGVTLHREDPSGETVESQVRIDRGAVSHRRSVAAAPDTDASSEGRSPFPWRPLVLFLAIDDGATAGLEPLLDGLLDADIEPRLAAPAPSTEPRRHRPCAPTATTVEQLAPDVLVALDAAALERAPAWCTRRGTVVIDLTPDGPGGGPADGSVELVSWQIDDHPTRLRARVSRSIGPEALAELVNRLAAGPQPEPPTGRPTPDDGASRPLAIRSPAAPARRIAVVPTVDPDGVRPPRPLFDGLIDRCEAAGLRVDPDVEPGIDLVFVAAGASIPIGTASSGTVVVVVDDIERTDVDELTGRRAQGLDLVAVAADVDAVEALRRAGVPAQLVPIMTPTARVDALRAAADLPVASSGGVVAWTRLGPADADRPDDDAVAAALATLTDERPDLEIVVVEGDADLGEQARRTAHVVTTPVGGLAGGDLAGLVASGHVGVPTVMSPGAARTAGGLADPRLVVTSPDGWTVVLGQLLDDDHRPTVRARATSEALDATATSDLVVARLLGWLDRRRRP